MQPFQHLAMFTTPQLMELAGVTRKQIQDLERVGSLAPLRRGRQGRGHVAMWSLLQTIAAAYFKAFLDDGAHHSWAYEAAKWVAAQQPGYLCDEFGLGRTVLCLLPDGRGWLIEPNPKLDASRADRLALATLDLGKLYDRVWNKSLKLVDSLVCCPRCQRGNAAANKLCANCGKPLSVYPRDANDSSVTEPSEQAADEVNAET